MRTEEEIKNMIDCIESRLRGTFFESRIAVTEGKKLLALKWVIEEVNDL